MLLGLGDARDLARFPRQSFVDVNVTGTLNLLEASSATPGMPFVFTSTTSLMISQAIRNELPGAAMGIAPHSLRAVTPEELAATLKEAKEKGKVDVVIAGDKEVPLQKLLDVMDVVRAHDITNVGDDEMVVLLWANEIFDRARPDTIASKV